MRTATLWSVMLAASLAACGSDAGSDTPTGDGDGDGTQQGTDDVAAGNGDDGADDPADDGADAPLCPLAAGGGLPPYEGAKTWSGDDFLACRDACPDFADACIAASCAPGFETFNTCVGTEVNACLSAQAGPCRAEFEAHICCASEKCDLNDAAAASCVTTNCAATKAGFNACGKAGGIDICIDTAVPLCLSAPPTTDPGAAGDGATDGAGTIPNAIAERLMLGRSSWGRPAQSASTGSTE